MESSLKTEERLRLLLNGNLSPAQLKQLEAWLTEPAGKGASSLLRVQAIQEVLREMASAPSTITDPDRVWTRIESAMTRKTLSASSLERDQRSNLVPLLASLTCCCVVLVLCILWWNRSHPPTPTAGNFGKILQLYSFKPDVTATAYNSKSGGATIIWMSGLGEEASQFGEIWKVYSFKPEITATSYDSDQAGATIIWVSGMDDMPSPEHKTSF